MGAVAGALGGAGVGLGLAFGGSPALSPARPLVLVACGGLGGAAVGLVAHALGRWTIEGLFGRAIPPVGGAARDW